MRTCSGTYIQNKIHCMATVGILHVRSGKIPSMLATPSPSRWSPLPCKERSSSSTSARHRSTWRRLSRPRRWPMSSRPGDRRRGRSWRPTFVACLASLQALPFLPRPEIKLQTTFCEVGNATFYRKFGSSAIIHFKMDSCSFISLDCAC